jgi:putative peptide zinc metalloprotease protein
MASALDFGPFLELPEDVRLAVAARARQVRVARSEHLLRAGDAPDAAFVVLAGRVRVSAPDGMVVATMAAPALVGELAVLEGRKRSADVVALEPVRALRIDADELRAIVSAHAGFSRTLAAFAEARRAGQFLRRQGPFCELPSAEIDRLASRLRPGRFPAGTVIMRQGERGDDVLLIRDGQLEAVREDPSGVRPLARLGPGTLIGEIAVLTGSPRTATVRALTDVDALVVGGDDVRDVVKRHRALLDRVTSVMQARHAPQRTGEHHVEPAPDDPEAVILEDRARAAYLRLDRQALAIYRDLDGERTMRDLALRHFERTGTLDPQAVFATVAALQVAGFATAPRVATDAPDGRLLRALDAILAPRMEIGDPDGLVAALYRVARPLFTVPAAAAAVVIGIGGLIAAVPVLRTASPLDFGIGGILVAFVALLLSGVGHEIAHALAAKAEGARLGRAGIGLFWFTPVVYVDTSTTWAIPRWGRIRVNAAGPLFNLVLAGAFALLARAASGPAQDVLVWLALTNVVLVVFNLSPLLEFDGYYVLADLTDTNALRRKAMRSVFADFGRPRRPASRGEAGALAYVLASVAYVVAMCVVAVVPLPSLLGTILPASLDAEARANIALGLGLALAVMLVLPFILEAVDARRRPQPGLT